MTEKQVSPYVTGLTGRCPECGKGRLFKGFISLDDKCSECGLDYDFADSGDGPAIFIMLIVGFIVVAGVVYVETVYRPPYWVHAALWVPGIIILSAAFLRPLKGLLIALQHTNQARPGQIDE